LTIIRFLTNSLAKKHSNGRFHPESAQRIQTIEEWIHSGTEDRISYDYLNESAKKEEILSVHSSDHYMWIKKTKNQSGGHFYFDADTGANEYTFEAARQAVAVGIKAIWDSTRNSSVFALVRPPGHHATRSNPQGFCIFNNIAIATKLAILRKKYKRIAIIDFDHHFGNGTAYIHEKNPNILYISTHADPRIAYPACGYVDEIGKDEGRGYNICVPLMYKASESDIKTAFEELILPIIWQFKPEFLAISSGFDAYERDPIGVLGVTENGFTLIGAYMNHITNELKIPMANFLEGGYSIQMLPILLSSYITPIIHPERQDYLTEYISKTSASLKPRKETFSTIDQAKKLLSDFWEL
jgi:acetoin utilization deacetylase AcuC-like enzyme